jgi:hypothetical protein
MIYLIIIYPFPFSRYISVQHFLPICSTNFYIRSSQEENQTKRPCSTRLSTSPPAALTALRAAIDNFLLFSIASLSLLAFVFDDPLGATPVRIFLLSSGVKLTKSTVPVLGVRGAFLEALVLLLFRAWKAVDVVFREGDSDSQCVGRPFRTWLDC